MTLRDPTAERPRLRAALGPSCSSCRRPIVELRLEAVELAESVGQQLELVKPAGDELDARLSEGLRQVRASTGTGSVVAVVEVAPWSRIPEARALFVPRRRMTSASQTRRWSRRAPRRALAEASREPASTGGAVLREEWRVVDRWWTEEPVDRRYFDVVLESGQNVCVFRDEEAGCWFSQRA